MKQKLYLTIFVLFLISKFTAGNLIQMEKSLEEEHSQLEKELKGFKCFAKTKLDVAIRLSLSGDPECFSLDGKECVKGLKTHEECRKFVLNNVKNVKPISCGNEMTKISGISGYTTKGHWCKKARKFFYKKWHCPDQTGVDAILKMDLKTFKVKCYSKDKKTCLSGPEARKKCKKMKCKKISKKKERRGKESPEIKSKNSNNNKNNEKVKSKVKDHKSKKNNKKKGKRGKQINKATQSKKDDDLDFLQLFTSEDKKNKKKNIKNNKNKENNKSENKENNKSENKEKNYKLCERDDNINLGVCAKGYAYFRYTGEYICVPSDGNQSIAVELGPNGEVECLSANKKSCIGGGNEAQCLQAMASFNSSPNAPNNIQCGPFHKATWGYSGYEPNRSNFYCSTGYNRLYNPIRPEVLAPLKKKMAVVKQEVKKKEEPKKKEAPNWFKDLTKAIQHPLARTVDGLKRIKQELTNKGMKLTKPKWDELKKKIKTGQIKSPQTFNKAVNNMKNNLPGLRNISPPKKPIKPMPKWFDKLKKVLKSPQAKTEKGLKKIKKNLEKHNFKPKDPKQWNAIKKSIKSGGIKLPDVFKKIVKKIKEAVPKLKKVDKENKIKPAEKKIIQPPKWYANLLNFLKKPKAGTKKGIEEVKETLKKHKFSAKPEVWKDIKKAIVTGNILKPEVKNKIDKKIKESVKTLKNVGREKPKFIEKIEKKLKSPEAKTRKGLEDIKKTLVKNNYNLKDNVWKKIENKIKTGQVKGKEAFKKVMNKIQENLPKFKKPEKIKQDNFLILKVQPGKKCGNKFFRKLKKLLNEKDAKTESGLKKIKEYLNSHFETDEGMWERIKTNIINGTLSTEDGVENTVDKIKENIPREKLTKKHQTKNSKRSFLTSA
jgi:hypothetical protein